MKKIIITYGLIAGAIVTAFMVYSTYLYNSNSDFKPNAIYGYTGMLIAFSFVFLGIKNFRDKANNGIISFGKAFKIGLGIALLASLIYVAVWLIEYYFFIPDFMDKFAESSIKSMKAEGLSATELKVKTDELIMYKEWYKNPLLIVLLTLLEVLPLGIIVALISALILKRKVK